MSSKYSRRKMTAIASLSLLASCASDSRNKWLTSAGREIEPVARAVDYWGTSSISTPLLTTPNPKFSFDLNQTALTYYTHARTDINGGIGQSTEQSSVTTSGTTVQANLDQIAAAALAVASGGLTALPTVLKPTTAPAIATNVLPTDLPASKVFSTANFAALQSLLAGDKPILDDRTAVLLAAGDKATQDILTYLAGPSTATQFKDKLVMFGTGMVSVHPGTHTTAGYSADLDVAASYIEVPARTDVLMKLPLADRIKLYRACLRMNWKDAEDAEKNRREVQKDLPEHNPASSNDQADRRLTDACRAADKTEVAYQQARLQYQKAMLYEARTLLRNSGVSIDTTPLYAIVFKDRNSSEPKPAKVAKPQPAPTPKPDAILPPPPPTSDQLFGLAERINQLEKSGNGKVRVLEADGQGGLKFDPASIGELAGDIKQANEWNQEAFANVLRSAVQKLEQQADDAKLIADNLPYANQLWPTAPVTEKSVPQFVPPAPTKQGEDAGNLSQFSLVTEKPFNVSLSPKPDSGAETRPDLGDYSIGRLSGPFSYRSADTRHLEKPFETSNTPYIAALSPMSDAQVLDLKESTRRQEENATKLAIALSFLGSQAQSQAFQDYVTREQQDVATLSADNVEMAYSKGDQFGFRISPRLKAVVSPTQSSARDKSANILDPISFPVLIVIGVEQEDVRLFPTKNKDGIYVPGENQIRFRQSTRWTPQLNPCFFFGYQVAPDWFNPKRFDEIERSELAANVLRAHAELKEHATDENEVDAMEAMSNRIDVLGKMVLDDWDSQYFPADVITAAYSAPTPTPAPAVTSISPDRLHVTSVTQSISQKVVIIGSGLKNISAAAVSAVAVSGAVDPGASVDPTSFKALGDSAIQVGLTLKNPPLKPVAVYFKITYTTDAGDQKSMITPPMVVDSFYDQSLKIIRTETKGGKESSKDQIEYSPGVDPNDIDRYLRGPEAYPNLLPYLLGWHGWFDHSERPASPPPPRR